MPGKYWHKTEACFILAAFLQFLLFYPQWLLFFIRYPLIGVLCAMVTMFVIVRSCIIMVHFMEVRSSESGKFWYSGLVLVALVSGLESHGFTIIRIQLQTFVCCIAIGPVTACLVSITTPSSATDLSSLPDVMPNSIRTPDDTHCRLAWFDTNAGKIEHDERWWAICHAPELGKIVQNAKRCGLDPHWLEYDAQS